MAFHNPDPKLREIELKNAELRSAAFSRLYRFVWRFVVQSGASLARGFKQVLQVVDGARNPSATPHGCRGAGESDDKDQK